MAVYHAYFAGRAADEHAAYVIDAATDDDAVVLLRRHERFGVESELWQGDRRVYPNPLIWPGG